MSEYAEFNARMLAKVEKSFLTSVKKDAKLKRIAGRIRDGTTYDDALDYAERAGELLSESYLNAFNGLDFVTGDTAQAVLPPTLEIQHDLMATVIEQIQNNINQMIGSNLQPQVPEVDTNRIDGLVKAVSNSEGIEHTRELLSEPVINFTQSIVDRAVRDNAKLQSDAGHKAYIVRTAEAPGVVTRTHIVRSRKGKEYKYSRTYQVPCEWCARLAGRYDYESVRNANNDVYKRHSACRCRVTYTVGSYRQNVWKHKETWTEAQADEQRQMTKAEMRRMEREAQQQYEADTRMKLEEIGFTYIDHNVLQKADKTLLSDTVDRLKELEDRFNVVKRSTGRQFWWNGRKRAWAYVTSYVGNSGHQELTIGNAFKDLSEFEADVRKYTKMGWWMPMDMEDQRMLHTGIITHEYGHMLHNLLYQQKVNAGYSLSRDAYVRNINTAIRNIARRNNPQFDLMKNISEYGQSNEFEFFAEVFMNSQCGKPNELGVAMQEWLKQEGF